MAKSTQTEAGAGRATAVSQPGRNLKRALQSGKTLVGGMLTEYARPSLVKLYVNAGFDFLYSEYEHGFFDPTTLADTVFCARDNGLPVIAKTPQLERAEVAKLLECGIVGIQLPRSDSVRSVPASHCVHHLPTRLLPGRAQQWGLRTSWTP